METPGSVSADAPADPPVADESTRVWPFLFEPRWILWHVLVVAAFWGMLWLGDWQFHRAMGGNGLSWAYTFEWPLFSGFSLVFWARTVRDEFRHRHGIPDPAIDEAAAVAAAGAALPAGLGLPRPSVQLAITAGTADSHRVYDEDDPEVDSYNAYLTRLNNGDKEPAHGRWQGF